MSHNSDQQSAPMRFAITRRALWRFNLVMLSVFTTLGITAGTAQAAPPVKQRCELADAFLPFFSTIAGEIYGLTALVKFLLVIAVVALIFLATTVHGNKILRWILIVLAGLVALSVLTSVLGIFPGATCK